MHEILKEKSRVKRLSTPDSFSVFILSFKLDSSTEISNFRTVCHAGTGNFPYTNKLKKRKTPGRARGDSEEADCFCNTKMHEILKEKSRVKRLSTPESFSFFILSFKLDSSTEISIFRTVCHAGLTRQLSLKNIYSKEKDPGFPIFIGTGRPGATAKRLIDLGTPRCMKSSKKNQG